MFPNLTHLQFFVLSALMDGPRSGREVREELDHQGQRKSLASFYQLMSRLEEAGMVRGHYETKVIDGQTVKERVYELEGHGVRCLEETQEFYRSAGLGVGRLGVEGT